jgi:hypothetical protein
MSRKLDLPPLSGQRMRDTYSVGSIRKCRKCSSELLDATFELTTEIGPVSEILFLPSPVIEIGISNGPIHLRKERDPVSVTLCSVRILHDKQTLKRLIYAKSHIASSDSFRHEVKSISNYRLISNN